MASVFRLGRDKKKRKAFWYFEYVDHTGKKRMRKGFTDKSLTEQLAAKRETEARLRRLGLVDSQQADLAAVKASLIEPYITEYEDVLTARKNTPKYVKIAVGRVRRIVAGCEFRTLGDIAADAVEGFLLELLESEEIGNRTYNHYLQAIDGFGGWLVAKKGLQSNPVDGIEPLNSATDIRHKRRALTPVEFTKLVQSARDSAKTIQCYDGETRARIYLVSYFTGLRRSEIASLTPRSFNLNGDPPTVTILATISKHRREDVLPLHPELAAMLRKWLQGLKPDEPLFPKLARRRTWLMVKKDLERVGIAYSTSEGIADFHAAGRHTYITELLRNGASLPQAKELARHSDINMTMRYTHIGMEDQAKALHGLPVPGPKSCQDIVRNRRDVGSRGKSTVGNDWQPDRSNDGAVKPSEKGTSDAHRRKETGDGNACHQSPDKWRRRESNLPTILTQPMTTFVIAKTANSAALHMRCIQTASKGTGWQRLTPICSRSLIAEVRFPVP